MDTSLRVHPTGYDLLHNPRLNVDPRKMIGRGVPGR